MLAPLLADELHNPHHSLFSVHISSTPQPPPSNPPSTARPDQSGSFASTPPQPPHSALPVSTTSSLSTEYPAYYPSEEEVRSALPHPNAYFCPKENGWVILSWKNSTVPPPFAASFTPPPHCHIPDQTRRKRVTNCLTDDSPYGPRNKTHHFHRYEKAVDSHKLTPPYMEDPWVTQDALKSKRRGKTIVNNMDKLRADEEEESGSESSGDSEGMLMDLYMCCQCGLYCTVSPLIPGVIQRKYLDELYRDKKQNPTVGKSGEVTVSVAIETFLV
jgi:ubiquitin carboxyl-terminal hydrolase 25/28